jgi:hypothetical protein
MTSAELKQKKDMFMCPNSGPNGCLISVYACARRYKLAKKTKDKNSWNISEVLKDNLEQCINCKIGEENKKKYKERENIDFKVCECGEIFYKQIGDKYWSRMRYCEKHSAMNYYERKKDIDKILKEKKGVVTLKKEMLEDFSEPLEQAEVAKDEKENFETLVEVKKDFIGSAGLQGKIKAEKEHKLCANEDCQKIFYRKEESKNTWDKKLYCHEKCRKQVENKRKIISRQSAKTKIKDILESDKPEKAAQEKWEELNVLLSILVEDKKNLDLIRVAAVKVGKSCYKQALTDLS